MVLGLLGSWMSARYLPIDGFGRGVWVQGGLRCVTSMLFLLAWYCGGSSFRIPEPIGIMSFWNLSRMLQRQGLRPGPGNLSVGDSVNVQTTRHTHTHVPCGIISPKPV